MKFRETFKNTSPLLYLSLLVALPFAIWPFTCTNIHDVPDLLIGTFFGLANGLLFTCLLLVLSLIHPTLFLWASRILLFLSYTAILPVLFYYFYYQYPFSSASIVALLETNRQEASEFIASLGMPLMLGYLVVFILVLLLIFFLTRSLIKKSSALARKSKMAYLICYSLLYMACILKNDLLFQDNMFFAIRDVFYQYQTDKDAIRQNMDSFKNKHQAFNASREKKDGNETYVLIIGEALSRNHMSLYGYKRNTNPKLNDLKNELICFNNIISPNNTTVKCLQKIFTFANCENNEALFTQPGLLDVLNRIGFTTYWISNQCYSGEHDSWATLFSRSAHQKEFTNFASAINSVPVYDGAILEPFAKALQSPAEKKFIIVHLIGSHQRADFRYPVSFSEFNSFADQPLTNKDVGIFEKRYVNSYDNSVLYNDFVVSELISMLKSKNQNSFALYFPDHGEEVCEQSRLFGHSDGVMSCYMVEIPLLLWQSEKFKQSKTIQPDVCNRPYQTDDAIHSILDLLDIRCDYFVPKKSIFNSEFIPEKRWIENKWDYDSLVFLPAKK